VFDLPGLEIDRGGLELRKKQLLSDAEAIVQRKINLSSPPEIAQALYLDLGLPRPTLNQRNRINKINKHTEDDGDDDASSRESDLEGCTKDSVIRGFLEEKF